MHVHVTCNVVHVTMFGRICCQKLVVEMVGTVLMVSQVTIDVPDVFVGLSIGDRKCLFEHILFRWT